MEGDIPKAESLLSRQAIRFGSQHQLREAVWLVAEIRKRKPEMNPWTLFLQDREGRVAGDLTLHAILHALLAHVPTEGTERIGREKIRRFIRESLEDPIQNMAEKDLPRFGGETSLGQMIAGACYYHTPVVSIVNPENRLVGVVNDTTLLSSLSRCLQLDPVKVMEELQPHEDDGAR
jgi:CBS domain-containing protein